jgi:hypothetical protein
MSSDQGRLVWNPHPESYKTISWTGGCKNGHADGEGTLVWLKNGREIAHYQVELRDGRANGQGVEIFADGRRNEGEFRDG